MCLLRFDVVFVSSSSHSSSPRKRRNEATLHLVAIVIQIIHSTFGKVLSGVRTLRRGFFFLVYNVPKLLLSLSSSCLDVYRIESTPV